MEPQNSIVLRKGGLQPANMKDLHTMAQWVLDSGFAPKSMTKSSQVVIAMQHGMELGLAPMQSLKAIAVVNGVPSVYGDAALALVRRSGKLKDYKEEWVGTPGKDDYGCKVTTMRHDTPTPCVTVFTIGDAKRAHLWGKRGPWTEYSERMLMFRSRGFNLRDNFGDVLAGLATYEEVRDYPDEAFPKLTPVDPEEQTKMEREAANEAYKIEMEAVLATTKIGQEEAKDATFTETVNTETGEITDETQVPDEAGQDVLPQVEKVSPPEPDHVDAPLPTGSDSPVSADDQGEVGTVGPMSNVEKLLIQIREIEEAHPDIAANMRNSKTDIGKFLKTIAKGRTRNQLIEFELDVILVELKKLSPKTK